MAVAFFRAGYQVEVSVTSLTDLVFERADRYAGYRLTEPDVEYK